MPVTILKRFGFGQPSSQNSGGDRDADKGGGSVCNLPLIKHLCPSNPNTTPNSGQSPAVNSPEPEPPTSNQPPAATTVTEPAPINSQPDTPQTISNTNPHSDTDTAPPTAVITKTDTVITSSVRIVESQSGSGSNGSVSVSTVLTTTSIAGSGSETLTETLTRPLSSSVPVNGSQRAASQTSTPSDGNGNNNSGSVPENHSFLSNKPAAIATFTIAGVIFLILLLLGICQFLKYRRRRQARMIEAAFTQIANDRMISQAAFAPHIVTHPVSESGRYTPPPEYERHGNGMDYEFAKKNATDFSESGYGYGTGEYSSQPSPTARYPSGSGLRRPQSGISLSESDFAYEGSAFMNVNDSHASLASMDSYGSQATLTPLRRADS